MSTAAASPGFMCRLKDRKEVAHGTMAFYFEMPPGFQFKPGQIANLTLSRRHVRTFSIASAPFEADWPRTLEELEALKRG